MRLIRRSPTFLLSLTLLLSWTLVTFYLVHPNRLALAQSGETVRVGLVVGQDRADVGSLGLTLIIDPAGSTIAALHKEVTLSVTPGGLLDVPGVGAVAGPLTVRALPAGPDEPGHVTVGGRPYRGELSVFAAGGRLTVVNIVPLEDYLLGVVPREMPHDFPLEALKAQAVAARTYALYARASGAYAAQGFDLLPTTASQVYGGVLAERETTTRAVRETAGEILTYQGRPIGAFYHSTSGGHTESVEHVWGYPTPYLKGVPDRDQESPHHTWTVTLTRAELTSRLASAGHDVGLVRSLIPVGRPGPGGRYLERLVSGTSGEVVLRSERVRSILGLRSALFDVHGKGERMEAILRRLGEEEGPVAVVGAGSSVRLVEGRDLLVVTGSDGSPRLLSGDWAVTREEVPATFTFEGRGWGHGVGLSQWGARGMALEGRDYRDILTHYYTGVTLGTIP